MENNHVSLGREVRELFKLILDYLREDEELRDGQIEALKTQLDELNSQIRSPARQARPQGLNDPATSNPRQSPRRRPSTWD